MFGRSPWRFLIGIGIALVVLSVLAGVAYQVGINVAAATIPASGGTTAPVAVPYYGYHPFGFGFGIFGFLFFLLFLFLIFGAIRAFAFGGRGRGWGGPGRFGGYGGPAGSGGDHAEHWRNSPWGGRAHDVFEQWHREAHGQAPGGDAPGGDAPGGEPPRTTGTGSTGQA
jgi:hypothetical protein